MRASPHLSITHHFSPTAAVPGTVLETEDPAQRHRQPGTHEPHGLVWGTDGYTVVMAQYQKPMRDSGPEGQHPYLVGRGGNQKPSQMSLHRVPDLKGNQDSGCKREQAQPLNSSEALGKFLNLPMAVYHLHHKEDLRHSGSSMRRCMKVPQIVASTWCMQNQCLPLL